MFPSLPSQLHIDRHAKVLVATPPFSSNTPCPPLLLSHSQILSPSRRLLRFCLSTTNPDTWSRRRRTIAPSALAGFLGLSSLCLRCIPGSTEVAGRDPKVDGAEEEAERFCRWVERRPERVGHGDGRPRRRSRAEKGRGARDEEGMERETTSPWRSATGSRSGRQW